LTAIKWIAGIILLGIAVLLLMPKDRIDSMEESWRRFKKEPGQACLDYQRKNLKDPSSARLINTTVLSDFDVSINYSAKNSYGANLTAEALCTVQDGKIDDLGTKLLQSGKEIKAELEELEAHNDCQQKFSALLRENWDKNIADHEILAKLGAPCTNDKKLQDKVNRR